MNSLEIARLAGVSKTTVSRVLNNPDSVNVETRNKILDIMKEYDFVPNTSARALKGISTKTIGLFIFNIVENPSSDKENKIGKNDYFMEFVNSAISVASEYDNYILTYIIKKSDDIAVIKTMFQQKRIDSAIIIGAGLSNIEVFDYIKTDYKLAFFDVSKNLAEKYLCEESKVILFNHNDYELTKKALNYLYEKGHRKIGSLQGNDNTFSGVQRRRAYYDFLNEKNIINEKYNLKCDFVYEKAFNAVFENFNEDDMPTAILSFNDGMALGAIEAFKLKNISVPEKVSIIGFDNIMSSKIVSPNLTTVSVPIDAMMEKIISELISLDDKNLEDNKCKGFIKEYVFDGNLIIRDSVWQI